MNMKRYLLTITLILPLLFGSRGFAQEAKGKLESTRTQIHILNLLNGLELDKKQMQLILDAAYEAEEIRSKTKKTIERKEKEIASAYEEVLKVAKAGSLVIPDDIANKVHKVNQEADKIRQEAQGKLSDLAIKIKDNLESHQLYVLEDYKPCIIPPVKEGRIGQADNPHGFTKVLERVRAMPEDLYDSRKDEIAQKAIDKIKAQVPAGFIIEEGKIKAQLLAAMDEARALSDTDFAIKKEGISQNIKTQLLPQKPPINIGVKIERFLLQPEIIPILEKRIIS